MKESAVCGNLRAVRSSLLQASSCLLPVLWLTETCRYFPPLDMLVSALTVACLAIACCGVSYGKDLKKSATFFNSCFGSLCHRVLGLKRGGGFAVVYWHYVLQGTIHAILTLCASGNNTGNVDIMCCRKQYRQYWHNVLQEIIQAILTLCAAGSHTSNIDIMCCRKQYRQYWHYVLQETIQALLTLCAAGNNTGSVHIT